ncbi:hypothetical protein [Microbacterium excoecariae]|uniref:hypothetical protein n=1 Tax=Microbacterium excoecariae TaxID=2715210 RepID=UPI00140BA5E4|nr:hypothetical protein [Microbacterium excoecariae]NHI15988.1 hypothetical protein [Microbacterium excoecariae]
MTSTTMPTMSDTAWDALREPTDGAAILANVRALVPMAAAEAAQTNAQGFMTEPMREALRRAGTYRVGFSASRGGPQVSLTQQTQMVEAFARADASLAWNLCILQATGFYASRLGDRAFAELYPELDIPTCGSFHPRGRADIDGDELVVSGTWMTGSGIMASERIVAGVEVFDGGEQVMKADGSPLVLGVWLPIDEVEILDDWHVIGLRGSGSRSYRVDGARIPRHHSFDRYFTPQADAEPLNKVVDLPFYSMAGIPVGIAQHAVDLATAAVRRKGADDTRRLGLLGEAESLTRAARAVVYAGVGAIDDVIFRDGELPSGSTMARGDSPAATQLARRVVDICAELQGSALIYERNPFEQLVRDLAGVTAHASTSRSLWVSVGRTILEESA